MELNNTTKLVKAILEQIPATREDDYLLWLVVLEYEASRLDHNATFVNSMSIATFLSQAKCCKYPHFETVSRIRRRLQEQYPELKPSKETQVARAELEQEYREYARSDV